MPNFSIVRPEDLPIDNEEAIEIMSVSNVSVTSLDNDFRVAAQIISQNSTRRSQSGPDEYSPEETRQLVVKRIAMEKEFKKMPKRSHSDLWKQIKDFYCWPDEPRFTIEKMKKKWHNANKDWRDHCKRMQNDEHYRERSRELPAHIKLIDDFNTRNNEARPNPIVTYDSIREDHEVVHSCLRPQPSTSNSSTRVSVDDSHNASQVNQESQQVNGEYGGRGDRDVRRERSRRLRRNDLYEYLHSNAQAIEKVAIEMRKLRETMQDTNRAFMDVIRAVFENSKEVSRAEHNSFDHEAYHRPLSPDNFSTENCSRSRSRSPLHIQNAEN